MASKQTSHAEAKRMLHAIEGRVARGQAGLDEPKAAPEPLSVAELCERFLSQYAAPKIKDLEKFRRNSAYALKPVLTIVGSRQAAQLVRADVERVRNTLARRYKPNTVLAAIRPFSTALSWAVEQGLIATNPAKGIKLPAKASRLEYLSAEEAAQLLAAAERQARAGSAIEWSLWVAVSLALYAGLRRGEILALRWQDVDTAVRRLTVARSYAGAPKSGKARHLPLPSMLVPLLEEWRSRCPLVEEGLICPVRRAGVWRMSTMAFGEIKSLYVAAGIRLPSYPWHCLRHSFASHFLMRGGSLVALSRLLGHADVKTTQIYAHFAPDYLAEQIDKVAF
jgi:integrase